MVPRRIIYFVIVSFTLLLNAVGQETSSQKTLREMQGMGLPYYEGNEMVLLPTGELKFRDMMEHIRRAKHFVHVEYFKFKVDSIGTAFFQLLGQKMREGVEVRMMYDGYGTRSSNDRKRFDAFVDSVKRSGMPLYAYDSMKFPWLNHVFHRDHRKIVVVDGEMAYIGGMNVCDYYIHGKPEVGKWRDMQVRIQGPAVKEFEHIFSVMWYDVAGEILELNPAYESKDISSGNVPLIIADRQPRFQSSVMRDTYTLAIDNAKELIQIVNPYPMNVRKIRRALYRALKRGVRVEMMVSTRCDDKLVPEIVAIEMKKLLRRGAHVYYYEEGFHHTKVMTVDGTYSTVGSTNLDGRSLVFDFEINAFVFDEDVTRRFQKIFEDDRDNRCTELKLEDFKSRFSLRRRILGRTMGAIKFFM